MKTSRALNNKELFEFLEKFSERTEKAGNCETLIALNTGAIVQLLGEIAARLGEPKTDGLYWRPIETWHKPEQSEWLLVWGYVYPEDIKWHCWEARWVPEEKRFETPDENILITVSHWMPMPKGPEQ